MSEITLQAGFARASITPKQHMSLTGYGNDSVRISTQVRDDVCATCVAFRDGEETVLMYTLDLLTASRNFTDAARESITAATGVPGERIMFCGTHTHSGPTPWTQGFYKTQFVDTVTALAQMALADLAPAQLLGAKGNVDGMNFVRHYVLANGTLAGANFGDFRSAPMVGHAHPNDPQLQVIRAVREVKKDIVLINWQAHPCFTSNGRTTIISADFVGPLRDDFEAATGTHCAYFTGAAGDQTTDSRMEDTHGLDCDGYAQKMSAVAQTLMEKAQPLSGSGIRNKNQWFTQPVNHAEAERIPEAQKMVDAWKDSGYDNIGTNKLARENGFESIFHANAIVRRQTRPETAKMELNALRVGGMAFVTVPFEMFNAHGRHAKDNSPNPITFVCSTANDYMNYIPTAEAYDYNCYESAQAFFAKGSGEAVAAELVEMLKEIQ